MKNQKQITVFKNQQSLLDLLDYLNDPKETGGYSDKICMVINNHKGENHSQKFVSFYIDRDEVKTLAHDIVSGTFKTNTYQKEKGKYQKFGGGKYSRILNITTDGNRYTFTITLSEAVPGPNKTVKPGKQIDQHSVMISDFETRKLFKTLHDYIDHIELIRMMNGVKIQKEEYIHEDEPVQETKETQVFSVIDDILKENGAEDIIDAFNSFGEAQETEEIQSDNDPIIPSGKYQGKHLSDMNDAYKQWILDNAKGDKWNEVKEAIRRTKS